jgi:uncharacterized short protein YbdD (DUF466 family)
MPPEPRGLAARCLAALRRVSGMPDYQAFVAHHLVHHPGQPVPTERDYFTAFVTARYSDGPTRCC